ncbi:MAG: folylpolyglutamate synthase/dihydrofolate synthase family protein [Candidatus Neomarinimicrobiota bacterium]
MGLNHTFRLLKLLKNPQDNFKSIHVAGTNGKGSTAAIIYSILIANGYKVGLYTSPHLINFNERIRVNGVTITDEEIISFMKHVEPAINEIKSTFFEVTTAMAFYHFNNNDVDIAIIETGLGGRLDSTNVVNPRLTVMTSISLDHRDILGDTIEKIAKEKAGIIKKGVPMVTVNQVNNVSKILEKRVKEKESVMHICPNPESVKLCSDGTSFEVNGNNFKTSLIGEHQAQNAALAIATTKLFNSKISYETIDKGLRNVYWPGRLQLVSDKIYYDVAHNEDGIKSVLKNLNRMFPTSKLYGLLCLKGDKEIDCIAESIKSQFEMLFVSTSKDGLLMEPEKLSRELHNLKVDNLPSSDISSSISKIKKIRKPDGVILIFGSHYIANEIFSEFEISFDTVLI